MSEGCDMYSEIQITARSPVSVPVDIVRPQSLTGLRILVIEDDLLIGMLFAETLVGMGHTICAIATTEDEAVAAAQAHLPDVMIVDARLQDGSGIAAVEKILNRAFVPHVFVTGDKNSVVVAMPHSVVVEKPFRVTELAAGITLAMTASRTSRSC
jgi:two-component system, response regulator PdtaR